MAYPRYVKKSIFNEEIEKFKLSIKVDKLHTVYVEIERFLEKWTKKKLAELEAPWQFEKQRKLINFTQWFNRFALAGAGVLTLTNHPKIGGVISIFYPLIELLITSLREKIEKKSGRWEEFFKDSEKLGNNFDKLSAIIESVKIVSSRELNNASEELSGEMYDFLKEYDENKDKKVEVSELKTGKFARDLKEKWERGKENKLREIVRKIQNLQREVLSYHHRL